jgi:hypothetical protein
VKHFFFEKKKQKTFTSYGAIPATKRLKVKSFLLLAGRAPPLFKKEVLPFLP